MGVTIDAGDPADRWRYTCPNGHWNWEVTAAGVRCHTCAERPWYGDGEYRALRDARTDELESLETGEIRPA